MRFELCTFEFRLKAKHRNRVSILSATHFNAVVADRAMWASGRPVELARDAPLHPDSDAVDLDVAIQRCPEIVVTVFVGVRYIVKWSVLISFFQHLEKINNGFVNHNILRMFRKFSLQSFVHAFAIRLPIIC